MKKYCVKAAAVVFGISLIAASPKTGKAFFDDVPNNVWYRATAVEAAAKGWFNGDENGNFNADMLTTRAQAAKIIYSHVYGGRLPSADGFSYADVESGLWYESYANINGVYRLIPDYGEYFEPEVYITRADAVTAIAKAVGLEAYDSDYAYLEAFPDGDSAGEDSYLIAAAVRKGILGGYTDGKLRLNAPVTHAQFAAFMSRACSLNWECGSVDENGAEYDTDKRIRSEYFYTEACTVTPEDGTEIAFIHYDYDGEYSMTYNSGWKSGEVYLPSGYYRIVLRNTNDEPVDLNEKIDANFDYTPALAEKDSQPFRTAAHRGYTVSAPQNTLSAFNAAADNGYTYIECDVRWTKDNVPMILHDEDIGAVSNGKGKLSSMTYEQVRKYDFGSYAGDKYKGEKIPSFEELMKLCKKRGLNPYVEIYDGDSFTAERARQLINIAKKYNMEFRITWISSYYNVLKTIKETSELPDLRLLYVISNSDYSIKWKLAELKNSTNRVGVDIDYRYLDSNYIYFIKNAGFSIESWTVDDTSTAKRLIKEGITGITTNKLSPF